MNPDPWGEVDPPSEEIPFRYPEKRSGKSRECPTCGAWHDTVVHDTWTGEVLEELEKCLNCLFAGCTINPITEQIVLKEVE